MKLQRLSRAHGERERKMHRHCAPSIHRRWERDDPTQLPESRDDKRVQHHPSSSTFFPFACTIVSCVLFVFRALFRVPPPSSVAQVHALAGLWGAPAHFPFLVSTLLVVVFRFLGGFLCPSTPLAAPFVWRAAFGVRLQSYENSIARAHA